MITRVTEAKIQKQNQNGFDIGRKRYINRDISIHIHTYTHTKKLITCRTDIAKRFIDMSDDDGKQIAQQNRTPSMYVSMLIWNVMKVFYVKLSTYGSSSITFSSLRRRSSSREVEGYFICRKKRQRFSPNLLLLSIVLDCFSNTPTMVFEQQQVVAQVWSQTMVVPFQL